MFGGGNRVEAIQADVAFNVDLGRFKADLGQAERVYDDTIGGMSTDALRLSVAQEKVARAIKRTGPESLSTKQATLGLRREMDSLAASSAKVERGIDRDTRAVDRWGRGAHAGSGAARGLVRSLAFTSSAFLGGAGLTYAIRSAVGASLEFERAMRNANSIAKLSEADLASLSDRVLDLAGPVAQAPKTLAAGLYDLESSGFSASESITILEASAIAATAGLTDTATSTKAIAAALNAYHLEADDARRVSDILFTTVDKGVLTFAELAQNMGDLVPAAAPLGVSLEEVGAAVATLTLQGVPAAEAATRVKNSLILLAKPSADLTKLFADQGYESGEAAVQGLGYAGVLELISQKTGGSVTATSKLAPEIRALLGVVGLTGKNLPTYLANLDAMEKSQEGAGRTSAVLAEQMKSGSLQLQRLDANAESLKIQLAAGLGPSINSTADGISTWLEKDENIERIQRDVNEVVREGTEVVEGLADGIDLIRKVTGPVVEVLGGLENVVQLALIGGIVYKGAKAVVAIRAIGTAFGITSRTVVAEAAVMGRAIDVATRPRTVVITTTGGVPVGVPGAPGAPRSPVGPTGRRQLPGTRGPRLGGALGIPAAIAVAVVIGDMTAPLTLREQQRRVADLSRTDQKKARELAQTFSNEFGTPIDDLITRKNPLLDKYGIVPTTTASKAAYLPGQSPVPPGFGGIPLTVPDDTKQKRGGGPKPEPFNADLSATMRGRAIQLGLINADDSSGPADDVAANRAAAAYYRAGLDTVQEGTKAYNTIYAQYVSFHRAELAAVDQINQEKERQRTELQAKREEDAEKKKASILKAATAYRTGLDIREQRLENAQERAELTDRLTDDRKTTKALIAFYKAESEDKALRMAERLAYGKKGIEEQKKLKGLATPEGGQEISLQIRELLASLHGVIGQFGSNVQDGDMKQVATHAYAQTSLLREQNEILGSLAGGMWFPGSGYSQAQLGAAGIGAGF